MNNSYSIIYENKNICDDNDSILICLSDLLDIKVNKKNNLNSDINIDENLENS